MYEAKLAAIYDAIHHFKDYPREAGYLLDAIRNHHPNALTLLEVACGTGLFLLQLRDHFVVEGQDLSASMLAQATRRLPDVRLHQGDMADFQLPARYDVVCCLFRSIANLTTIERFDRAVSCMAGHLAQDGILLIEPFFASDTFWDGHVVLNEFRGATMKVAWMHASKRLGPKLGRFDHHYLVGTGAEVEYFTETHDLGLFTRADYDAAFVGAGLQLSYDPVGPTGSGLYVGMKR